MNKSIWIGLVAGIGVAAAGGVAAYSFLGKRADEQASAARSSVVGEDCSNVTVAVTADPKDQHRIAGTAAGAVVGGAVGKDVGDHDITTAVGAAAGALIGRKIQEEIQEKRADQRTTTTTERHCVPAHSR